ncbi:MAG TPA: FAD synthase [Candidatus Aenigmarchaeota archaeon]|nr:FAD synthase [Candidatus Aenigmarchaeota archaeon]
MRKRIRKVLVGGTFNLLHPGHMFFLGKAREYGDHLTVVLATDERVLQTKGFLIFTSEERKNLVQNLKYVDNVVIGDDENMFRVVEDERPDVIVLGHDQDFDVNGLKRFLEEKGIECKIVRIQEKLDNYSTSEIVERIKRL